MWIKFASNGNITTQLIHGAPARQGVVGTFEIFCVFDNVDYAAYNIATISFRRPDGTDISTNYVMSYVPTRYFYKLSTESTTGGFNNAQAYSGFSFSPMDSAIFNQQGNYLATVRLYDASDNILVQGQITVNVQAGVGDDESDITQSQYDELMAALAGKISLNSNVYIKIISTLPSAENPYSGDYYGIGDILYNKTDKEFYKLESLSLATKIDLAKYIRFYSSIQAANTDIANLETGKVILVQDDGKIKFYTKASAQAQSITEADLNYLKLSGGTLTGDLFFTTNKGIKYDRNGTPTNVITKETTAIALGNSVDTVRLDSTRLVPNSNNANYLGSPDYRFADVYTNSISNGTGGVEIAIPNIMDKNTSQTISGLKQFTTVPETSGVNIVPTNDNQLTDNKYVKGLVSAVSNDLSAEAITRAAADTSLNTSITEINGKIPSQASSVNKLADKDWVNSTINSLAAYYITRDAQGNPFATIADLFATTTFYSGGEVRTPTRNDYCLVNADELHENASCRYIYQGVYGQGGQWQFQFVVNNTPFTAVQLAAINSGVNAISVAQITTNANGISALNVNKLGVLDAANTYQTKIIHEDFTVATSDWQEGESLFEASKVAIRLGTVLENDMAIIVGTTMENNAYIEAYGIKVSRILTTDTTTTVYFTAVIEPEVSVSVRVGVIPENVKLGETDRPITTANIGNGLRIIGSTLAVDTTQIATVTDLNNKQNTLVSGTNIKTINSQSLLGSGDIEITDTTYTAGSGIEISDENEISIDTNVVATQTDLATKQDTLTFDNTPTASSNNPVKSGGVYSAIQNVREVAEGKCKSAILSYADTITSVKVDLALHQSKKVFNSTGVDITQNVIDGDYDNYVYKNADFNSQADILNNEDGWFIFRQADEVGVGIGSYDYLITTYQFLDVGDNIFVIETEVPDRWWGGYSTAYKLETSKVDLTSYYTKTQTNGIVANDYDSTATYSVGDLAFYQNQLYKCITAVSTPEAFDNTKWTATKVSDNLGGTEVSAISYNYNNSVLQGIKIGNTNYSLVPYSLNKNTSAMAIGQNSSAGTLSLAIGWPAQAPGEYSNAFGTYVYARGTHSIAIGDNITVQGNYSIGLGSGNALPYTLCIGNKSYTAEDLTKIFIRNDSSVNKTTLASYTSGYNLNERLNGLTITDNSITELDYNKVNALTLGSNATFTLKTAPTSTGTNLSCRPEYKVEITTTAQIVITLPVLSGGATYILKTNDDNISLTTNALTLPTTSVIELNIKQLPSGDYSIIAMNWSAL